VKTKKILKIAALNIGIALFNVILFSPGIMNIRLTNSDALSVAIGGTAIFLSLAFFIYGNYTLLFEKTPQIKVSDIKNYQECIVVLNQSYGKKTFDDSITTMKEQVERFNKKKEKIFNMLSQKFNVIDKVYEKFKTTIFDVEYVFLSNIKSILNKISAFDEEDYERLRYDIAQKKFSDEVIASKMNIYNEYINFVKNAIEDNEEIIIKLDALLLEISKHDLLEAGEIDNLKEIKEMDELIKKSKYYI
jgi:flagellar biosynthesis chaperone FliJ